MAEKNTKQRLMEAAIDLFSVKGYAGTGVDEIAGAIGLKGPNLYKYFKGKDDLFNEIVKKADEEYERGLGASIRAYDMIGSAKELKDITLKTVLFTIDNETGNKMRRIFTIEQYRDELFAEFATKHQITNMIDLDTKVFKRLMKDGIMAKGDANTYALEFVAPITVMIQYCDRYPDKKDYVMKKIRKHIDVFIERYFIK